MLTVDDSWFIEKGQKDSLSKTYFEVGQTVVVCDNRHVMLAEFYEGECPTCHSHKTVPFSRQNVEPGILRSYTRECPECLEEVTILVRQQGANNPFVGRCPKCNSKVFISEKFFEDQDFALKMGTFIAKINMALGWILGLLIVCIIVLAMKGKISNDNLINYSNNIILPRTERIYENFLNFADFQRVSHVFIRGNKEFLAGNADFFASITTFVLNGLKVFADSFWESLWRAGRKTDELTELFGTRTRVLIEIIQEYIEKFI